jgi:hypothetical protein
VALGLGINYSPGGTSLQDVTITNSTAKLSVSQKGLASISIPISYYFGKAGSKWRFGLHSGVSFNGQSNISSVSNPSGYPIDYDAFNLGQRISAPGGLIAAWSLEYSFGN